MKLLDFIIFFCSLLFFFFSVPSLGEDSPSPGNDNRAQKIELIKSLIGRSQNLKHVVSSAFEQLGHDHNATILATLFPEAEAAVRSRMHRLASCFFPTIKGGTELKLFEEPLSTVVQNVISAYLPLIVINGDDQWLQKLREKVKVLVENIKAIAHHVIDCLKGLDDPNYEPTKLGLNRFVLLSYEEMRAHRHPLPPAPLGKQQPKPIQGQQQLFFPSDHLEGEFASFHVDGISDEEVPEAFDYREQGVVSVVKDQGGGNTCFLFAAVAALESSYMIKHKSELHKENSTRIISFSEKDVYNCLAKTKVIPNPANGGHVLGVYTLFKKKRDLSALIFTEEEPDPYDIVKGNFNIPPTLNPDLCHSNRSLDRSQVIGFASPVDISASEKGLMYLKKCILAYGPVTTQFRTECGEPSCPSWNWLHDEMNDPCVKPGYPMSMPDHAMVIVGWTKTHLIIKNSYGNYEDGDGWGKDGYLILNNKQLENCGILGQSSQITFPEVD